MTLSLSLTIQRKGRLVIIEDLGVSVTFNPNDKDQTMNKLLQVITDYGFSIHNQIVGDSEKHNVDIQLTQIYIDYFEERRLKIITDAEHLFYLISAVIIKQFRDQSGVFYAAIENNRIKKIIPTDSEEFELLLTDIFFASEGKIANKDTLKNCIRLIKSITNESVKLYNRVAKIGNDIFYDLCNETGECIKITKADWATIENPLLFKSGATNMKQTHPATIANKEDFDEIFNNTSIKYAHQRLIAKVYVISLFVENIAHPILIPIGPPGSGKTVFMRAIKLIVDPRSEFEGLVQRLPRDERDRRVTIYDQWLTYFDNESHLDSYTMDELCSWVTGFSKTIRVLHTTDEQRTYSGKRPIGINGINVPITQADTLNRCLAIELEKIPDGNDGTESKLIDENEYLASLKNKLPEILCYVFDVLVRAIDLHDELRNHTRPNHRLADFVIWGEAISRALGNKDNEFLKAWNVNVNKQHLMVIHNDTLAGLLISYCFNARQELTFLIEPQALLIAIRQHANEIGIHYEAERFLPSSAEWLSRRINAIYLDLRIAGLIIKPDIQQDNRRYIQFSKELEIHEAHNLSFKELEVS